MSQLRIDHLRELLASVGQQQTLYIKFFKPFSARLEIELGNYLGDTSCVARSSSSGKFTFDEGSYMESGLGFKSGKFVIPLMFRMKNLNDEEATEIRLLPLFTLQNDKLTTEFEGKAPITTSIDNIEPLLEYIYLHLKSCCEKSSWFTENPSQYQSNLIGFIQTNP